VSLPARPPARPGAMELAGTKAETQNE